MKERCKYCQKPILPDEEIKTFKKKKAHLLCHENRDSKLIKVTTFIIALILGGPVSAEVYSNNYVSHEQMQKTRPGFCPACQQEIEEDDVLKTFRSTQRKPWHLVCWKKKTRVIKWAISIFLVLVIGMIITLIVLLVNHKR